VKILNVLWGGVDCLVVRFCGGDTGDYAKIKAYIEAYEPMIEFIPEKPIPKCFFCDKQSTGVIFVVGDGESAYACREHEGLLARL
jgi:hypothetical protein